MSEPSTAAAHDLQFERAEFTGQPGQLTCRTCERTLIDSYFEINGQAACGDCRDRAEQAIGTRPGAGGFVRALVAGVAAGVAGALLYYAVLALTGYEIGLVAIVVGFLVGYAVRWGTYGRGGPVYQALAVGLTYLAIVSTYVPFVVAEMRQRAETEFASSAQAGSGGPAIAAGDARPAAGESAPSAQETAVALVVLLGLLLALPFLAGVQNLIGLLIIAFGLFEAWRLNKRAVLVVTGPYQLGSGRSASPEGP